MTDELNYVLQRIEYGYLKDNYRALASKDVTCLRKEGLPCNCMTGIVVNYSAFLTTACMSGTMYSASMEVLEKEPYYYLQCKEESRIVCPTTVPFGDEASYVVGSRLCTGSKGQEAYITFHSMSDLKHIEDNLEQYTEEHMLTLDSVLYLEFWTQFLGAMRVQPLSITSKAFLFMAIYLFPNRTLTLIWKSKEKFENNLLEDLFNDYLHFLLNIGGFEKLGFQRRFVHAFKASTDVDISAFIEHLSHFNKKKQDTFTDAIKQDTSLKTLMAGYHRNANEIKRRRSFFRRLCEEYLKGEDVKATFKNVVALFK